MKKWSWLSFVVGIVVGAILIVGIGWFMSNRSNQTLGLPGVTTMLREDEKGTEINTKSIKVMQTLTPKAALVMTSQIHPEVKNIIYDGPVVLYIASEDVLLYDEQVIEIPEGKKLVQIGTYHYETTKKEMKTVAMVEIR